MLRKILFWTHLAAGCAGGVIILTMSITGVALMYERQILARVERGPFRSTNPATRLGMEDLLARAGAQRPLPSNATVTLRSDPQEPVEIAAGRESTFYVDPATGRVLGEPSGTWRRFFQDVTAWHRWLGAKGEGRTAAKAVTGACNLAFLLLIVSGPFLWLPKGWTRRHLAPIVWFRRGLSGKARDFNWHNAIGIWTAVPLFFVVLTAAPMSYQWANRLLYRMTGSEPPAAGGGSAGELGGGGRGRGGPVGSSGVGRGRGAGEVAGGESDSGRARGVGRRGEAIDLAGLDRLWARAAAQEPGWRSISMRAPEAARKTVAFTIDTGDGGQPQKRSTLTLDRASGEVVRVERFADGSAGRRLRSWSRFVHTGEAYGIAGQTVAGVASGGAVVLVWTGIALSLRRLAAWRRRRSREEAREETEVEATVR